MFCWNIVVLCWSLMSNLTVSYPHLPELVVYSFLCPINKQANVTHCSLGWDCWFPSGRAEAPVLVTRFE